MCDDGTKQGIMIKIAMPLPEKPVEDHKQSLEEKAESACTLIESGHESRKEWNFIRKLNEMLMDKKHNGMLSEREQSLLKLIAPTINKHGMLDSRGVQLDPELQLEERDNAHNSVE